MQVILPDLRYNRTPIRRASSSRVADYEPGPDAGCQQGTELPGPYARNPDHKATMLGERQWQWLERQLEAASRPAPDRVERPSARGFHGMEAWVGYARDHERLIDVIRRKNANGVVFLSGDIHYAGVSKLDVNVPYTLWDLTSSGLTEEWRVPTPNANRASEVVADANFGFIDIDWQGRRRVSRSASSMRKARRGCPGISRSRASRLLMTAPRPVRAVFFDLDGTLVDSEIHTDRAIGVVAARYGIADFALPHTETRGRTWLHVAERIRALTKIDRAADSLAAELLDLWVELATDVNPVPGAQDAIRAAAASKLKLGVVSGSPRAVIDSFLDKLGVGDSIDPRARIGGDAVSRSKPDPEGYLLARAVRRRPRRRRRVRRQPRGSPAASAAGMRSVFITCCASDIPGNSLLATARCTHYRTLPPRFWEKSAEGTHRSSEPVVRVNATDPELLRRYRIQLFTATWLSYCGFYLTRKVYAVVKHPLKEQFGLDDLQVAMPWTIYLITYMLGQFMAAWLGRHDESRACLRSA